jgi:DNA-binding transcriptional ArsR family regulator
MSRAARSDEVRNALAASHPLRPAIVARLSDGPASPRQLAAELGAPLSTVAYHVRRLRDLGQVALVGERARRGTIEHFYVALVPLTPDAEPGLLARAVGELDAMPAAPAVDRLSVVAMILTEALDAAAWSVSFAARDDDVLHTVRGIDARVDPATQERITSPAAPDDYSLAAYPRTVEALRRLDGFFVARTALEHDPSERALLEQLDYDAVLATTACDRDGRYLMELYADHRTPDLQPALAIARVLTTQAVATALPADR